MKVQTQLRVIVTSLLLIGVTCLSSYATAGTNGSDKPGAAVAGFSILQVVAMADAAEESLEDLVTLGEPSAMDSTDACNGNEQDTPDQSSDKPVSCSIHKAANTNQNLQLVTRKH